MRRALALVVATASIAAPFAVAGLAPSPSSWLTRIERITYVAHNGVVRPAWLLLPADYAGRAIPLIISPHGRGVSARANARLWGNLPGEGDFAVVNPGGEGRVLRDYSWGAPGEIEDLARMPQIVEAHGVDVDAHRIYAIGGSMGGQETLLLLATHPRLLAGAAAFDPPTDMARRYRDFASLKGGRELQKLARIEIGGTPAQRPRAYALRSPDHYTRQIADSGVPLQIYWSTRDRVIDDQREEAGALAVDIHRDDPEERLWDFEGDWRHTAEMHADRRLPRALWRFGLLPWRDAPPVRATTPSPPVA